MACTSAPEDGAEVYLCCLGCVAAQHMWGQAVGGAVEGGVIEIVSLMGVSNGLQVG
jgi:hypothetical protein